MGDFDEKIEGKNKIVWKDFEFSGSKLNDELEPELDENDQTSKKLKKKTISKILINKTLIR